MLQKMNRHQEIALLKELLNKKHYSPISSGSSRIVFQDKHDNTKVIKLAIGVGAMQQNRNEINCYIEGADSGIFADIHRYGHFIEEMEFCRPMCDQDNEWFNWVFTCKSLKDIRCDMRNSDPESFFSDRVNTACDYLGDTDDNLQIGITRDGKFRMYDYGYHGNSESHQIGSAERLTYNDTYDYIRYLIKVLLEKRPTTSINEYFNR